MTSRACVALAAAAIALAAAPHALATGDLAPALRDGSLFSAPGKSLPAFVGEKARWVRENELFRIGSPGFSIGGHSACEALVTVDGGKVGGMRLSLFNRGDMGPMQDGEGGFRALVDGIAASLSEVFGAQGRRFSRKTDPTKPDHDVEGLRWSASGADATLEWAVVRKGVSFEPAPEWLRLDLSPPGGSRGAAEGAGTIEAARREDLPSRVTRVREGAAELVGVPMVDQGSKGYCAAATVARVMAWYGLDFIDQHQIAGWAGSDPRAGTSDSALGDGLARVLHDRYKLVWRKLPGGSFDLLAFLKTYNKAARKKDLPQVVPSPGPEPGTVDGEATLRRLDPGLFIRLRTPGSAKVQLFADAVKRSIDSGVPVIWSVLLGFVPEEPPVRQEICAHVRLLTGYDENRGVVIYSDSWGAGHERKEMDVATACAITTALHAIAPTLNRN